MLPPARRSTPEDVANVYLFLASDEASYVTGALYEVDGAITKAKGAVGKQAKSFAKQQPEGELEHSMEGATDYPPATLALFAFARSAFATRLRRFFLFSFFF